MKRLYLLLVLLVLALAACGSATTQANTPTPTPTDTPTPDANAGGPAPSATVAGACGSTCPTPSGSGGQSGYSVGQTVSTADGFDITVNSVSTTTNSGNEFETPSPGDQWIVIDVSVKNMTGSVQQVNPLDFTLIDSTGQHMNWTILSSLPNTHTFDLTALQPGATNRGVLEYEVPTGKHSYQLSFAIDQFSGTQTIWDIHS